MKKLVICSLSLLLALLLMTHGLPAQQASLLPETDILEQLKEIPGCKVKPLANWQGQGWELILKQPLDHNNPKAGYFKQHIYLKHTDTQAPTVLVTEGYSLRGLRDYELAALLGANQVRVEYRYFGESAPPKRKGWQYLRNQSAADDLHRIRQLLGKIYQGPWINTGISKGGQTSLIYRRFYPEDVAATVAYVAPMALGLEDPRTDRWQDSIGSDACRESIRVFQRSVLEQREAGLEVWTGYAKANKQTFPIGAEVAFEYAVLEYPFSFWQSGVDCHSIPASDAPPTELTAHLLEVVGTSLYTKKGIQAYQAHFYQAMYEQGYYGFPTAPVSDLLRVAQQASNRIFAPQGIEIPFQAGFVPDILDWLDEHGDKILYIYGEIDTWTACAVHPNPVRDALKLTVEGGNHGVRLKHLTSEQKQLAYEKLESWIGINIQSR
ncbi:MAG: S28 family serine protease [Bacteroidota bacterium]